MTPETITFKRDEFFQMMGKLALPPGSGAPHDTPCAPIASRIIAEVEAIEVRP